MRVTENTLQIFRRQHGVALLSQLGDRGLSPRSVRRCIDAGELVRVAPRVVRLASHEFDHDAKAMAGWLHCGPSSFVSHFSAGRIHGIRYMPPGPVHITIPGRSNVTTPTWLVVSRTTWMIDGDVVGHPAGFRIASPCRMLHQLAGLMTDVRFERAAEDAWHLRLVTPGHADEYLAAMRRQGRSGVSRLERWLADVATRTRPMQSGLEADALVAIRRAGLPTPERQYPVRLLNGTTIHLDFAWPAVKYSVEPGHSWWHGGDDGQRADQARDRKLGEVGWMNTRFDEKMRGNLEAAAREIGNIYRTRVAERRAPTIVPVRESGQG